MKTNTIFAFLLAAGLLLLPTISSIYAQAQLGSSNINSGATNSTSSSFILISTIGQIAGAISSSGFQIIAGFLPQTQGGNTIPTGLFPSGVTPTFGSSGQFLISTSGAAQNMDFSKFSTFNGATDSVTTQQDFEFTDGGLGGTVLIKAGTTITAASDWDGTFSMPEDRAVTTVTAPGGGTATQVIRMGLPNIDFNLNQPMRFTFTGKAGQNAATVNSAGTTTEITTTCNGVDFDTVNAQLSAGQACKINNNSDLLVWTRTLSDKFTFSSAASTSGGGSLCFDCSAPSFTQFFKEHEYPLIIGKTFYPKLGFYNEKTVTAKLETQTLVPIKLLMYENVGTHNVQHVALYMNLHGTSIEAHQSDTWIVYEKNHPLEVSDPNGFFSDVSAETSKKGDKFEVTFNVNFAKPMETSNLAIIAWDSSRNGRTVNILDAFEVIKSETKATQSTEKTESELQPSIMDPEPGIDVMTASQEVAIQKWAGFHQMSLSDSELLDALYIKSDTKVDLPKWTKNSLGRWMLDEQISFKEFRAAIEYVSKIK